MAYQSLYRKYRPQTFADVVGQGHVVRTLQNALASGRVAHGYLFTGTRGTAKTTIARLLAKALNCESQPHPVVEPCNRCNACKSITAGNSIDVVEMDAASHRGVADVEEVRKSVGYGPMELRYKVFIIDEAHQLSNDAKDAFLKTLEEPPDNVVFILATTEPQSIPITIRSRCQQFDFKRGSLSEIASRLRFVLESEGVAYTPEAVNLVARGAEGSYRDSLSLLEQVLAFSPKNLTTSDVVAVLGTLDTDSLAQVTQAVANRDAATTFALAGQLLDAGKEARTLLRTLSAHFRDLLLVKVGGPAVATELTPEEVVRLQQQAQAFTDQQMLRAVEILNEAQGETRWNNQHRLLVELAFLKLMTIGDPPNAPLPVAPIVFSPAAAVDLTAIPIPIAEPVPVAVNIVAIPPVPVLPVESLAPPVALNGASPIADDGLDANYFADSTASDEEFEQEELLPEDLSGAPPAPAPSVPVSVSPVEEVAAEEIYSGPSLFDDDPDIVPAAAPIAAAASDVAEPLTETQSPAETVSSGYGLFDEEEVGVGSPAPEPFRQRAQAEEEIDQAASDTWLLATSPSVAPSFSSVPSPPPVEPAEEVPPPEPYEPDLFTMEDVYRAWPRFLMESRRLSKRTEIMMASAHPERVYGSTLEIVFPGRFQYDMMSTPKAQEFVRKLFARCLGVPKLAIKFVLSENAPPRPVRIDRQKKVEYDPLAAIDALDVPADGLIGGYMPSEPFAPATYRPPTPAPVSVAPSSRFATAPRHSDGMTPPARRDAAPRYSEVYDEVDDLGVSDHPALSHPLVQEILQIFGGEIMAD